MDERASQGATLSTRAIPYPLAKTPRAETYLADKTLVEFVAALADSPSAIKFDGRGDGGKVVFEFDRSQVAEVAKLLLYTEKALRVRIEAEE